MNRPILRELLGMDRTSCSLFPGAQGQTDARAFECFD